LKAWQEEALNFLVPLALSRVKENFDDPRQLRAVKIMMTQSAWPGRAGRMHPFHDSRN
jgi:hypothetical protein